MREVDYTNLTVAAEILGASAVTLWSLRQLYPVPTEKVGREVIIPDWAIEFYARLLDSPPALRRDAYNQMRKSNDG